MVCAGVFGLAGTSQNVETRKFDLINICILKQL
jgi:hypothetical protein